MNSQTIFADLRNILAYLYPDEASARTIVADAGIDARNISFSSQAITNWHNILNEAFKTNRVDALLGVVQKSPYGKNEAFQEAYRVYQNSLSGGAVSSSYTGTWLLTFSDLLAVFIATVERHTKVIGVLIGIVLIALLYARGVQNPPPRLAESEATGAPSIRTVLPTATPTVAAEDSYRLAVGYMQTYDYLQAIPLFKSVIAQQPDHANALYNLGVCYQKIKESEQSIAAFEEFIRQHPEHAKVENAHYNLGVMLRTLKNFEWAKEHFMQVKADSDLYEKAQTHLEALLSME